jgi:hypothetical protein
LLIPDIAFDGSAVVKLRDDLLELERLNKGSAGTITIRLELTTTSSDGLVLWQGERQQGYYDDEYEGPFLAIASE